MICSGMPPTSAYSSMASRVVPGISVTMARSSRRSALSRLDFPTFGFPTIAVVRPSRRILPAVAVFCIWAISARMPFTVSCTSQRRTSSISSSGKSIAASICAISSRSVLRIALITSEKRPVRCPVAILSAASVFALTTSMTAAACVRSSLPFRKARFVNSPRSAGAAPPS